MLLYKQATILCFNLLQASRLANNDHSKKTIYYLYKWYFSYQASIIQVCLHLWYTFEVVNLWNNYRNLFTVQLRGYLDGQDLPNLKALDRIGPIINLKKDRTELNPSFINTSRNAFVYCLIKFKDLNRPRQYNCYLMHKLSPVLGSNY